MNREKGLKMYEVGQSQLAIFQSKEKGGVGGGHGEGNPDLRSLPLAASFKVAKSQKENFGGKLLCEVVTIH